MADLPPLELPNNKRKYINLRTKIDIAERGLEVKRKKQSFRAFYSLGFTNLYLRSKKNPRLIGYHTFQKEQALSLLLTAAEIIDHTDHDHDDEKTVAAKEQQQQKQQYDAILMEMQAQHDKEVAIGLQTFGPTRSSTTTSRTTPFLFLDDTDFTNVTVPLFSVGPEEANNNTLHNSNVIFQSRLPLITPDECEQLVQEARSCIQAGMNTTATENDNDNNNPSSSTTVSHSALGEARVSQLPRARTWLTRTFVDRMVPLLESRFFFHNATQQQPQLVLYDALVIGYGCLNENGSKSQPMHRDSSLVSVNVALSPRHNYTGGGTFFESLGAVLHTPQGHVLTHAGSIAHAGRGIDAGGERWILVLFCIDQRHPQFSRRCHANSMQGSSDWAKQVLHAGLRLQPNDHLLHTSLGQWYMGQNQTRSAATCWTRAAASYPYCGKASLALGRLYLTTRRPRAALRRFDAVLQFLDGRDLEASCPWTPWRAMGWDARIYGSQATIMCAQYALTSNGKESFDVTYHLTQSKTWLEDCLRIVPNDPRVHGMLDKTNELLEYC